MSRGRRRSPAAGAVPHVYSCLVSGERCYFMLDNGRVAWLPSGPNTDQCTNCGQDFPVRGQPLVESGLVCQHCNTYFPAVDEGPLREELDGLGGAAAGLCLKNATCPTNR